MKKFKFKFNFGMKLALMIISVSGFIVGALKFAGVIDLTHQLTGFVGVILGIGLMFEGNIKLLIKDLERKRIEHVEFAHISTLLIGFMVLVIGIIELTQTIQPHTFWAAFATIANIFGAVAVLYESRI